MSSIIPKDSEFVFFSCEDFERHLKYLEIMDEKPYPQNVIDSIHDAFKCGCTRVVVHPSVGLVVVDEYHIPKSCRASLEAVLLLRGFTRDSSVRYCLRWMKAVVHDPEAMWNYNDEEFYIK